MSLNFVNFSTFISLYFQMVILSLILKRARIKALVKDKRSTEEAFGTYVEVCSSHLGNSGYLLFIFINTNVRSTTFMRGAIPKNAIMYLPEKAINVYIPKKCICIFC
jgi:hypothetical protein